MNYQEAIETLRGGCLHADFPLTREEEEACSIIEALVRHRTELEADCRRHVQNAIDAERACMGLRDRVKELEELLACAQEELASVDQTLARSPSSRPPHPDAPVPYVLTGKGG